MPGRLILQGAIVFDGESEPTQSSVCICDGQIASIVPTRAAADGDRVVNIAGKLLIAGLIDVHTHLFLSGGDYDRELLKASIPLRTLRGAHHARLALARGVTTLRDVCTEGAGYADVALRDAIEEGLCAGPRIVPSGPGLGITGGYLPMGFADHVCVPSGCMNCNGPDDARRAVREQAAHGVEWIKVFADWRSEDPRTKKRVDLPTFTRAELDAVVDEAWRRGRKVAAHACTDAGARQAIECGVASLEHVGPFSDETFEAAAKAGIFLVPTLSAFEHLAKTADHLRLGARPSRGSARPFAAGRLEAAIDGVRRARKAGVTIAFGTDIGVFPHENGSASEFRLLMEAGLSPMEALRSATVNAAALLGLPQIGRIAPGCVADLCAYDLDDDLHAKATLSVIAHKHPSHVWRAGELLTTARC